MTHLLLIVALLALNHRLVRRTPLGNLSNPHHIGQAIGYALRTNSTIVDAVETRHVMTLWCNPRKERR